jgi:hypothetical protein
MGIDMAVTTSQGRMTFLIVLVAAVVLLLVLLSKAKRLGARREAAEPTAPLPRSEARRDRLEVTR